MVRSRSCRVIYYFDIPALGRRHQSFGRVTQQQKTTWVETQLSPHSASAAPLLSSRSLHCQSTACSDQIGASSSSPSSSGAHRSSLTSDRESTAGPVIREKPIRNGEKRKRHRFENEGNKIKPTALLRFLLLLQVSSGEERKGRKGWARSTRSSCFHAVARLSHAPPVLLHSRRTPPAIPGVLGTIL